MAQRHDQDDRYCICLRRLAEREGFSPEILVEKRTELAEVQIYDFFFQEFRPLLLNLHSHFPEHRLILNVASGTPAMKSALYLLAAFLPFPVLPVQTATPTKAQNLRLEPHTEYDTDLYWECNLDNEDYIDRCQECRYENLNLQLQKESILTHLNAYDYAAALTAAKTVRPLLSPHCYDLLEAARLRLEMNWRAMKPAVKMELGLLNRPQKRIDLEEYLLWLQMKQKREDLADFLRGLTPGLYELLKLAVEEKAGYPVSSYCDSKGRFCRDWMTEDSMGQGSHIVFSGINPVIELQPHQLGAIARVLYGGNTLLAHEVGAGKTFEMIAAAMESKRLGLCHKSIFVVPNHLTEQTASEFLRLYPAANILVTTKRDFETAKRKKFCARIVTGDYDAVIIGHSQFEKIPISTERQKRLIEEEIDEITEGIREAKAANGEHFTIKQLERTRKDLEARLKKLMANYKKDSVVTFEQLGVDRMFVDESDNYKNLFLYTKMRNVAGLSTADAQKSSDMFAKCRYLDEITHNRGVIFATGTPISNSMTEMYSI